MEKAMETTVMGILGLYWGYMRVTEKKKETTIMGHIRVILSLYGGNGKENGNYYTGFMGFRDLDLGFRVEGPGRKIMAPKTIEQAVNKTIVPCMLGSRSGFSV